MALDKAQVELAVRALLSHLNKTDKSQLFNEENHLLLQITFKKVPREVRKPKRIPLPHSLFDGPNSELCLITKDPTKEYEALVEAKDISQVTVMGVSKLRDNYKPYEAKRKLCASYDMFLADDRVVPLLPRLLGKKFYETKKKPISINMKVDDLAAEIAKARDAAYLYLGPGACSSLKIGHTKMSREQLVENIMRGAAQASKHVSKGNILNMHIMTSTSVSLPIFSSLPTVEDFAANPDAIDAIKPFYKKKEGKKPRKDADGEVITEAPAKSKKRKTDASAATSPEKKVKKSAKKAKAAPAKAAPAKAAPAKAAPAKAAPAKKAPAKKAQAKKTPAKAAAAKVAAPEKAVKAKKAAAGGATAKKKKKTKVKAKASS